jgi:hypothetical protein
MTRNQELNVLHVKNSTEFAQGIDARIVSGDTLIFDFIYFLHPVITPHVGRVCSLLGLAPRFNMYSATFAS